VTYKADAGSIKDLSFFSIGSSGTPKALEGTYDEEANTFTCKMDRAAVLAIAAEAAVVPTVPAPETGDAGLRVALALMLCAAAAVGVLTSKKRYF